ncbi:MAG: glycosyltransferase [Nocardioides sp.]|nr:glycosyltransferase [Nocardioides sp.]
MLLLAMGSRGDVEPMVALAAGLRDAGHRARVLGLADYEPLARAHGVDYVPVAASIDHALEKGHSRVGRLVLSTAPGQGAVLARWMRHVREPFTQALLGTLGDGEPGEAVLSGVLTRDVATALHEARGARPVTVVYTGQLPTLHPESHFFSTWFVSSDAAWARAWNRTGIRNNWIVSTSLGRDVSTHVRRALGLPVPGIAEATRRADAHPTLVAASPVLVPTAPDWPAGTHQTGQLVLPERGAFEPDDLLAGFLASGPPPVYVGFGSMAQVSGERSRALVTRAARLAGRRVVTPADPGTPTHLLADDALAVAHVAHDWLLPRMAGVVHHGGAGTTGTTLRAGVPSVAVPFGADQPYHARRLHALGVGPAPVPIQRLASPRTGPQRLARLLTDLVAGPGSAGYRARAAQLGARVRAEDGVGEAVAWLTNLTTTRTPE